MKERPEPPKWVLRLLDWWVDKHLREEIEGDLYELYDEQLRKGQPHRAKRNFVWNALRFCRLRNFDKDHLNLYPMLWKNYLRVALRQLRRDKRYALINIFGIAIGITSFLIVFFYIQAERSFDQHHPEKDRIFRVVQNYTGESGEKVPLAYSFNPLSRTLEDHFPEVEKTTRIFSVSGSHGESGGQFTNLETQDRYIENDLYFADSTFFDLFSYPFIEGRPEQALEAPFSIILKAATAKKYFKDEPALGKVLEFRDDEDSFRFTVGGVVADPVGPSHFDFNLLASFSSLRTMMPWIDSWHHPPVYHYALLAPGVSQEAFSNQLAGLPRKIFQGNLAEEVSFEVQPITDIHLYSQREGELFPNGRVQNLTLFGIIGFLILLIACINYMNLATARASTRLKEVSIRRVFGARRRQLIQQFLGESLLFTTLAFGLAVLIVQFGLPQIQGLFQAPVRNTLFSSWSTPLILVGLLFFVSLLAGFYPSLFLSAMQLRNNFRGRWPSSVTTATSIRKGLVIFQFTVSGILISMALLIGQQVRHLQHQKLGFEQDQVLIIPLRDQDNQINYETIKSDFLKLSRVLSAAGSSGYPGGRGFSEFFIKPRQAAFDSLEVLTLTIDQDFVETYGLSVKAGRDFSPDFPGDAKGSFVINEALARRLDWKDPVGQELSLKHYYYGAQEKAGRVVGVVGNFPYRSLREPVRPVLFHMLPRSYFNNYLSIKVNAQGLDETLVQLEDKWSNFNPDRLFEYYFLDEAFARMYEQEQQFNTLFQLFTGLAVIIACLGLFALAAFSMERRSKEVAVRKVLGASAGAIILQLSGQFARLALIALLIAIPLAWYFARLWLNNFADRIPIGWWNFTVAGVLIVALAVLVSSYHAFRAANLNPAQVLKHDE